MSGTQGLVLLAAGAAAAGFVFWIYLRREVPIAGRSLLAGVRVAALVILLLLLLNPSVPGEVGGGREPRTWVALDLSLSMAAGAEGEPRPWDRAVERATELRRTGATVAAFGEAIRFLAEDPLLLEGEPTAVRSALAPLLERALEAGASEVVVLSDLHLDDPLAVRALLERSRLAVRFEDVGGGVVNAGVARWELPSAVAADETVSGVVLLHASEAAAGRTATVEVREEERLVLTRDVELPEPGLLSRVEVELPVPATRGTVRYEARVRLPGDALASDDTRARYLAVDPEEGLLVAVSLVPDWELRFLLPVLEQVTGLTARGYVRVGEGRYLPAGGAPPQRPVDAAEVRRRVESAEMLVLHGLASTDPEWLRDAATRSRRAVLLPADAAGAAAVGVNAGAALPGEWYVAPDLPASPLAAELAGAAWQGLPPLTAVLPGGGPGDAPLELQLRGGGAGEPALLLRSGSEGRRAVVLASGFWRWAFRDGPPRDAYRRLWAGVAGWLLADALVAGAPLVRPLERVVPRGEPVRWAAPGLAGDSVRVRITQGDSTVADSVLAVDDSGGARSGVLPPGRYAYHAAAPGQDGPAAEGEFDVEAYTDELRHPAGRELLEGAPRAAGPGAEAADRGTRPLRTHPLPYILLLGLLCGEWVDRRRKGLR